VKGFNIARQCHLCQVHNDVMAIFGFASLIPF
jgi:hypothetical protein